MRIRVDHARMQQLLLLLRGALHARRRAQPRPRNHRRRVETLFANGYREVTLLGQNVNSYRFGEVDFPELLRRTASVSPQLRVRFATSHPKDMSDRLLETMASMPNICRAIHLPAQSGASTHAAPHEPQVRPRMVPGPHRRHSALQPDCAITTDLIAGFSRARRRRSTKRRSR